MIRLWSGRGSGLSRCLAVASVLSAALLAPGGGAPAAAAAAAAKTVRSTAPPTCAPAAAATSRSGSSPSSPIVRLPRDEAAHHAPNEWWYFSGHLWGVDPAGRTRCYGFEYVTFQFLGVAPSPVYFGNLAVTDLTRHTFHYAVAQDSYPVPDTPGRFALHTGTWSMRGSNGQDRLRAALPGYGLDLTLRTTKPAELHGKNGVIPFGPFGTSKYYSWTSLLTAGTIRDHSMPVRVLGTSWMDHQWGAFDFASGGGWDWFSLQLSNGQQYMLYFIRNRYGRIVQVNATRVGAAGGSHDIAAQVAERALGTWRSSVTGITYSSGWELTVPGGHLRVTPQLRNQELDLRSTQGVAYWEGAVSVQGRIAGKPVTGRGYTEINPAGQP